MKNVTPDISVVMAVYNGEKFLKETLDSILSQTFENFEVVVIDDCSTDGTADILKVYSEKDGRIKVFKNETNMKLARSLNRGIELAQGKYIVRMDADDICLKNRLERQFSFMESHPKTDLSFCKFFSFHDGETIPGCVGRKTDKDSIKAMFLFFCPVLHPGVIVKSSVMKKYKYDPSHTCSEDLDLWIRMVCDGVSISSSGDFLMLYRIHGGSITANSLERQKNEVLISEKFFYEKMLAGFPKELERFYINGIYFKTYFDKNKLCAFYKYISAENDKKRSFSKQGIVDSFAEILAEYKRQGKLSAKEIPFILRFGGLKMVRALVGKKARAKNDIKSARQAAAKNGFVLNREENGLPIYCLEKR